MKEPLFTKNFTLLVIGQISSLFGNFILKFALSMYVLELTGSAAVFASLLAIATVPTILLSPLGGILADRANRRTIMVVLDVLSGLTVLAAAVFLSEQNAIGTIGAVMVVLSILGAFESPTVQACVPQMHKGENLVRANAVVGQVMAVSALVAPILGAALYTAFGIQRILTVTMVCFFLTAGLECFIKLDYTRRNDDQTVWAMIGSDFRISIDYVIKKQRVVLKILLLAAAINFLLTGVVGIGLPYFIRNILGLGAGYYGVAESILGVAAIGGSVAVGFLATRLKTRKLFWALVITGAAVIGSGLAFLLPINAVAAYCILVISAFVIQISASVFSIFMISLIQQKTPNELIGKLMAYAAAITMCAQPLGQMVYGLLFEGFNGLLYLILFASGLATCAVGFAAKKTFSALDSETEAGVS